MPRLHRLNSLTIARSLSNHRTRTPILPCVCELYPLVDHLGIRWSKQSTADRHRSTFPWNHHPRNDHPRAVRDPDSTDRESKLVSGGRGRKYSAAGNYDNFVAGEVMCPLHRSTVGSWFRWQPSATVSIPATASSLGSFTAAYATDKRIFRDRQVHSFSMWTFSSNNCAKHLYLANSVFLKKCNFLSNSFCTLIHYNLFKDQMWRFLGVKVNCSLSVLN